MSGLRHQLVHQPLFTILSRPSPTRRCSTSSESVATHVRTRDIVRGGTVATGVATPLNGRPCILILGAFHSNRDEFGQMYEMAEMNSSSRHRADMRYAVANAVRDMTSVRGVFANGTAP